MIPVTEHYLPDRKAPHTNGDGETSRDFCFIENVVQINIFAATARAEAKNHVYNVALGHRTAVNTLAECGVNYAKSPAYREFRAGDVRNSQADISKAGELLGYELTFRIYDGIGKAMPWYYAEQCEQVMDRQTTLHLLNGMAAAMRSPYARTTISRKPEC